MRTLDPAIVIGRRSRTLRDQFEEACEAGTLTTAAQTKLWWELDKSYRKMLKTAPETNEGAVAMIDAFLVRHEVYLSDAPEAAVLLKRLRKFLKKAAAA